ncbi:MAG: hypothetical protein KAR38_15045, partial [Calditrichia bacterium]|nr:hypothetical protein [Calditrichia bacterium]
GSSETVQDVDYVIWGDNTDRWIDKTGIGTYLNDTPVATQLSYALQTSDENGNRMLREVAEEANETESGGNGIDGHDETSEHFSEAFLVSLADPNPGTFGFRDAMSGDGHASLTPSNTEANQEITLNIKVWGDVPNSLDVVTITIPENWNFSEGNISTSGDGFSGTSVSVAGNLITIDNAVITGRDTGLVSISNIFAEGGARTDTFKIATAVSGETPVEIATSPNIEITPGATPIIEIQENPDEYNGTQVKVRGVIAIGPGVTITSRTSAWVIDETGAGLNIFNFSELDTSFTRGDSVEIFGTIEVYTGSSGDILTEIMDYTLSVLDSNVAIPNPIEFTTGEIEAHTNYNFESFWVSSSGTLVDKYIFDSGDANLTIDDGSGECVIRVWNTTGINLAFYNEG